MKVIMAPSTCTFCEEKTGVESCTVSHAFIVGAKHRGWYERIRRGATGDFGYTPEILAELAKPTPAIPPKDGLPGIPATPGFDPRKQRHACDCEVAMGGYHHPGCDMEPCPACGGQFLHCNCFKPMLATMPGLVAAKSKSWFTGPCLACEEEI